jgi:hypothetical protein
MSQGRLHSGCSRRPNARSSPRTHRRTRRRWRVESVSGDVLPAALKTLATFGRMVVIGLASGKLSPFNFNELIHQSAGSSASTCIPISAVPKSLASPSPS